MLRRLREQLLEVPAPLEVHEGEPERAAGDPTDDPHHVGHRVVVGPEPLRIRLDARGDLGRDGHEQHLVQQHRLHHATPEREVAVADRLGELLRSERLERRDVELHAGHRVDQRVDHGALHAGEAAIGCRGGGERPGHRDHLVVRRGLEVGLRHRGRQRDWGDRCGHSRAEPVATPTYSWGSGAGDENRTRVIRLEV